MLMRFSCTSGDRVLICRDDVRSAMPYFASRLWPQNCQCRSSVRSRSTGRCPTRKRPSSCTVTPIRCGRDCASAERGHYGAAGCPASAQVYLPVDLVVQGLKLRGRIRAEHSLLSFGQVMLAILSPHDVVDADHTYRVDLEVVREQLRVGLRPDPGSPRESWRP